MNPRQQTKVYWSPLTHPAFGDRPIYLAATAAGLCQVTFPHESLEYMQTEIRKRIPDAELIYNPDFVSEYVRQVRQYFDGERRQFTCSIDFRGTPFQTSVWQALVRIPYGEVRSYSDIAQTIGNPKAVRAVGAANGANPIPIVVPCHRVIGKNNALTGFRGGLNIKETLLRLEGFDAFTPAGHERYLF